MAIRGVSTELLQFYKPFEALLRAISDVHAPSDIRIVGAGNEHSVVHCDCDVRSTQIVKFTLVECFVMVNMMTSKFFTINHEREQ